ncbi:hypothetical protein AOA60_07415, partial [Pseudomonas sp. 2822-17]
MANIQKTETEKLKWINEVFESSGFMKVEKRDQDQALSLNNLRGKDDNFPKYLGEQNKKVSIIIPAYNAEDM